MSALIEDDLIVGAVDCHVHACPHINARSLDVIEAAREALAAGMTGLGLMDNFANSSGYAALARRVLGPVALDIWGGLIMEPPAGGVSAEAVAIALGYGYGPGTGARFISLPTHHTRHVARGEGRSPLYVEACFEVPETGPLPDPLPEILDRVAAADVVFNTGHVAASEAVRLVGEAKARGVQRILVPASHYDDQAIAAVIGGGAVAELSYFFASPAADVPLTHVDAEAHVIAGVSIQRMAAIIRRHGAANLIVSSDCGVGILPRPVEGLRLFLRLLAEQGIGPNDLRRMISDNPARLFKVAA
ncbi:hypothetical protein E8L99_19780 [Phreatobacter aquaticus]|uniref:Uncharacterized protein n=1 Tax=Phreatobacter aquaticus TaxID=2570229 RepID=A0A4D7QPH7_9HYPH|nr:DUF6282 family protein [Phreatobacter aquaticus]QCK87833.1 hypothetical protein E8L99_19780 [Phreatobacter aquaticus]